MPETRTQITATPLYPGSFFPEDGRPDAGEDARVERLAEVFINEGFGWMQMEDLRMLALAAIHALQAPAPQVDTATAVDVRPADSDAPATDPERSALMIDALWTEDPYPEYSQDDVLHAYRLGYEDGTR